MRRQYSELDLGNAISTEDALSMMVVIFVLFVLFLVPMVNIDKMKLEKAGKSNTIAQAKTYVEKNAKVSKEILPYQTAFEIDFKNDKYIITKISKNILYIEVSKGNKFFVIKHDKAKKRFIMLINENLTDVATYKWGSIDWSNSEKEWFTYDEEIDYGESEISKKFKNEYFNFVKKRNESEL